MNATKRPSAKSLILMISIAVVGAIPGWESTGHEADAQTTGLVLHLPFNEASGTTAVDISGYGRNAFLLPNTGWKVGRVGGALSLTGTGSGATVPAFGLGEGMTFLVWVNIDTGRTLPQNILSNRGQSGWGQPGFSLFINSWPITDHMVNLDTGNGRLGASLRTPPNTFLYPGWHHLTVTINRTAGTGSIYVDGVRMPTTGGVITDFHNNLPYTIGRHINGYEMAGGLDELRVYNRILSASEIATLVADTAPRPRDTTAPSISNVAVTNVTGSTARITWTTNEPADTQVDYGPSLSYGLQSPLDSAMAASHSVTLSGLAASTRYNYRVRSKDSAGNVATSINFTFATLSPQPSSPTGLILHLPFDEGSGTIAADASGNGRTGALANGATWTGGRLGSAVAFDGHDDHVSIADHSSLGGMSALTAAMWVNLDNWPGGAEWGVLLDKCCTHAFAFNMHPTRKADLAFGLVNSAGGVARSVVAPGTSLIGNWHFIAGIYDGSSVKTYLNGVDTGNSVPFVGTVIDSPANLGIGGRANTSDPTVHQKGKIDDLRIYNRALSASEISALYNRAAPAPDTAAPVISSVSAGSTTGSSTVISWTTSEPSTSQVEYGLSTSYGSQTALDTNLVTFHAVVLPSLSSSTSYNYRVKSRDSAGNLATGANFIFATAASSSSGACSLVAPAPTPPPVSGNTWLAGRIMDSGSGQMIPARIYIQNIATGRWYFPGSSSAVGSAVPYQVTRSANSLENHTTLSAHPFRLALPQGSYRITVERGKEYHPLNCNINVGPSAVNVELRLQRFVNMAAFGWYSGDTHVHRQVGELPNVMLAEDVNVAFPVGYWTHRAGEVPGPATGDARLATIDSTHVFFPGATEYEIDWIGNTPYSPVLSGLSVINAKRPFPLGLPTMKPIAQMARDLGALLDTSGVSLPWTTMLQVKGGAGVHFQLANNTLWRTNFYYKNYGLPAPAYMNISRNVSDPASLWDEQGWIDYTHKHYWALLNSGVRLSPTAGTASGVHPVPLGFSRVYVYLPNGFSYQGWLDALKQSKSFVTTGPMLMVKVNGQGPGSTVVQATGSQTYRVQGTTHSARPVSRIQLIVNGDIVEELPLQNSPTSNGGLENTIDTSVTVTSSSWIAVRVFENMPDGRPRFAHSAPFYIDVAGKPLYPRFEEISYLIKRVEDEIPKLAGLVSQAALDEFYEAAAILLAKLPNSR